MPAPLHPKAATASTAATAAAAASLTNAHRERKPRAAAPPTKGDEDNDEDGTVSSSSQKQREKKRRRESKSEVENGVLLSSYDEAQRASKKMALEMRDKIEMAPSAASASSSSSSSSSSTPMPRRLPLPLIGTYAELAQLGNGKLAANAKTNNRPVETTERAAEQIQFEAPSLEILKGIASRMIVGRLVDLQGRPLSLNKATVEQYLREDRIKIPELTFSRWASMLQQAGEHKLDDGSTFFLPSCLNGDKCIAVTDRISCPWMDADEVSALKPALMSYMTPAEYDRVVRRKDATFARAIQRICVLCQATAFQKALLLLRTEEGRLNLDISTVWMMPFRVQVDTMGGFYSPYTHRPRETRWEGFVDHVPIDDTSVLRWEKTRIPGGNFLALNADAMRWKPHDSLPRNDVLLLEEEHKSPYFVRICVDFEARTKDWKCAICKEGEEPKRPAKFLWICSVKELLICAACYNCHSADPSKALRVVCRPSSVVEFKGRCPLLVYPNMPESPSEMVSKVQEQLVPPIFCQPTDAERMPPPPPPQRPIVNPVHPRTGMDEPLPAAAKVSISAVKGISRFVDRLGKENQNPRRVQNASDSSASAAAEPTTSAAASPLSWKSVIAASAASLARAGPAGRKAEIASKKPLPPTPTPVLPLPMPVARTRAPLMPIAPKWRCVNCKAMNGIELELCPRCKSSRAKAPTTRTIHIQPVHQPHGPNFHNWSIHSPISIGGVMPENSNRFDDELYFRWKNLLHARQREDSKLASSTAAARDETLSSTTEDEKQKKTKKKSRRKDKKTDQESEMDDTDPVRLISRRMMCDRSMSGDHAQWILQQALRSSSTSSSMPPPSHPSRSEAIRQTLHSSIHEAIGNGLGPPLAVFRVVCCDRISDSTHAVAALSRAVLKTSEPVRRALCDLLERTFPDYKLRIWSGVLDAALVDGINAMGASERVVLARLGIWQYIRTQASSMDAATYGRRLAVYHVLQCQDPYWFELYRLRSWADVQIVTTDDHTDAKVDRTKLPFEPMVVTLNPLETQVEAANGRATETNPSTVNDRSLPFLSVIEPVFYYSEDETRECPLVHIYDKCDTERYATRMIEDIYREKMDLDPWMRRYLNLVTLCALLDNYEPSWEDVDPPSSSPNHPNDSMLPFELRAGLMRHHYDSLTDASAFFTWIHGVFPRLLMCATQMYLCYRISKSRGLLDHACAQFAGIKTAKSFNTFKDGARNNVQVVVQLFQIRTLSQTVTKTATRAEMATATQKRSFPVYFAIPFFPLTQNTTAQTQITSKGPYFFFTTEAMFRSSLDMPESTRMCVQYRSELFANRVKQFMKSHLRKRKQTGFTTEVRTAVNQFPPKNFYDRVCDGGARPTHWSEQKAGASVSSGLGVSHAHFNVLSQLIATLPQTIQGPESILCEILPLFGASSSAVNEFKSALMSFAQGGKIDRCMAGIARHHSYVYSLVLAFSELWKRHASFGTYPLPAHMIQPQIEATLHRARWMPQTEDAPVKRQPGEPCVRVRSPAEAIALAISLAEKDKRKRVSRATRQQRTRSAAQLESEASRTERLPLELCGVRICTTCLELRSFARRPELVAERMLDRGSESIVIALGASAGRAAPPSTLIDCYCTYKRRFHDVSCEGTPLKHVMLLGHMMLCAGRLIYKCGFRLCGVETRYSSFGCYCHPIFGWICADCALVLCCMTQIEHRRMGSSQERLLPFGRGLSASSSETMLFEMPFLYFRDFQRRNPDAMTPKFAIQPRLSLRRMEAEWDIISSDVLFGEVLPPAPLSDESSLCTDAAAAENVDRGGTEDEKRHRSKGGGKTKPELAPYQWTIMRPLEDAKKLPTAASASLLGSVRVCCVKSCHASFLTGRLFYYECRALGIYLCARCMSKIRSNYNRSLIKLMRSLKADPKEACTTSGECRCCDFKTTCDGRLNLDTFLRFLTDRADVSRSLTLETSRIDRETARLKGLDPAMRARRNAAIRHAGSGRKSSGGYSYK